MRASTLALLATLATAPALAGTTELRLFKAAGCGCCELWAEHMAAHGFRVNARNVDDLGAIKALLGVPVPLASCHTAVVDGYVIEGHVPAGEVRRLLAERPAGVAGLSVPAMPAGSPGMPSPTPERYDVIGFGGGASAPVATYVGEERVD